MLRKVGEVFSSTYSIGNRVVVGILFVISSLLVSSYVKAQSSTIININRSADKPVKIAIVPFNYINKSLDDQSSLFDLIYENMRISGALSPMDTSKMISHPQNINDIVYKEWDKENVEYLIIGGVRLGSDNKTAMVKILIVDILQKREVLSKEYKYKIDHETIAANVISNDISKKITGIKGIFSSKIAYVESDKSRNPVYRLYISNLNGSGAQMIVQRGNPIFSLSYSPKTKKIAYVSYDDSRRASIFIHDMVTHKYKKFDNGGRGASAPSWDKSGKTLFFASKSNGGTDIYSLDLSSAKVKRITRSYGLSINTEPSISLDGKRLLFTSDRYGYPTVMEKNLETGKETRLLKDKVYTVSPKYWKKGQILFTRKGDDRIFAMYKYYVNLNRVEQLTSQVDVELFSISPNGEYVAYVESVPGGGASSIYFMHLKTKNRFLFLRNRPNKKLRESIWIP